MRPKFLAKHVATTLKKKTIYIRLNNNNTNNMNNNYLDNVCVSLQNVIKL